MPAPGGESRELAAMARCFMEEFVLMGWDDPTILALFRNPFYRGPYLAYQQLGEACVQDLLDDVRRR